MKNSFKHLLCLAILLVVLIIGSCHKDNALTSADKAKQDSIIRLDSIHTVDSLRSIDSVHHISMGIDSASGKYWCEHHYSSTSGITVTDTILGHDTVTVSRGAGSTQMIVNGEVFNYQASYGSYPYPHFYNGDYSSNGQKYSYPEFTNGYNDVYYMFAAIRYGPASSTHDYYTGTRIR